MQTGLSGLQPILVLHPHGAMHIPIDSVLCSSQDILGEEFGALKQVSSVTRRRRTRVQLRRSTYLGRFQPLRALQHKARSWSTAQGSSSGCRSTCVSVHSHVQGQMEDLGFQRIRALGVSGQQTTSCLQKHAPQADGHEPEAEVVLEAFHQAVGSGRGAQVQGQQPARAVPRVGHPLQQSVLRVAAQPRV